MPEMDKDSEMLLDLIEPKPLDGNLSDESVSTGDEVTPGVSDETPKSDDETPLESVGKQPYTQEELEHLLVTDGEIDTARMSAEGKLLMKSFQRGFGRKFEELAEMRKAYETEKTQAQDPKEIIYQRYVTNPVGTIGNINAEIEKLVSIPPSSEEFTEAQRVIVKLNALKDELGHRRMMEVETTRDNEFMVATTEMEIKKAIPDIETKRNALTDFAIGMGLTIDEVRYLTDPYKVGNLAIKLTKVINQLYDKSNAGKTAEQKVVKASPKPLARGGATTDTTPSDEHPTDLSKMTNEQYRAWRAKQNKRG